MLRKTIAIAFLFIFLCANTELGQLFKLPNLLHHFLEHHDDLNDKHYNEDQDISFLDFIAMHYGNNSHHADQEKHDHENLPFKTLNTSVTLLLAIENPQLISFSKPKTFAVTQTVPFRQEFYTSDVFASIWLPPKLS